MLSVVFVLLEVLTSLEVFMLLVVLKVVSASNCTVFSSRNLSTGGGATADFWRNTGAFFASLRPGILAPVGPSESPDTMAGVRVLPAAEGGRRELSLLFF